MGMVALALSTSALASSRLPDFVDLVKKAAPAVVNIQASHKETHRQAQGDDSDQYNQQDMPEIFRRFFHQMPRPEDDRRSVGSGFIISSDGYILTNYHVIDGANQIIVSLADRREREAKVVGKDKLSDLALLKIDARDLPTVQLGSSAKLEVGEWVVAIGSPFGFEHSVTAGIVSAKGRSLPDPNGNYVPFIQTDVAINPGNSGGPLFNMEGQVVGINSQIFTRSGGFMGLSFAIPIDVAMDVVEQLKADGKVERGWLGVLIQRVDRDLAESFKLDRAAGALVTQVFQGSPAAKAGLKEGDIIIEFDGKQIDLSSDLPHVVGRTKPGKTVDMVVVRKSKRMTLKVTVGKLDESKVNDLAQSEDAGSASPNQLGVDVKDMAPDEKARLGVDKGVLVVNVGEGAAEVAGIQEGDVITTINNEWVDSADQFRKVVSQLKPNVAVPIRIVRNRTPRYLVIKITQ
ncbi:MAG TPA: DegQ family serine endoprotease [Pseudomonadales bacterium]|nr:DegQ family serine endoprotease [Pseudomonadales bacterium]